MWALFRFDMNFKKSVPFVSAFFSAGRWGGTLVLLTGTSETVAMGKKRTFTLDFFAVLSQIAYDVFQGADRRVGCCPVTRLS